MKVAEACIYWSEAGQTEFGIVVQHKQIESSPSSLIPARSRFTQNRSMISVRVNVLQKSLRCCVKLYKLLSVKKINSLFDRWAN